MNINWYPGHMKKTVDQLKKIISMVNIVYELVDARIPISSKNPILDEILKNTPRIICLNKADMAEEKRTMEWIEYFQNLGITTVAISCKDKNTFSILLKKTQEIMSEKVAKDLKKGIQNTRTRLMIAGIPNVGKSTFINAISQKNQLETGNRPGVTKSNCWVKTFGNMELLDTPGILWPKIETEEQGRLLAYTGAIKDEIFDIESLSFYFIQDMLKLYPERLKERYAIDCEMEAVMILDTIGKQTGKLFKGGEIDYLGVAKMIFSDFRNGKLGRITLESAINESLGRN